MAPAVRLKTSIGPNRRPRQVGPVGSDEVADQPDDRVERRVPVRLLAGERPEPGEHGAVERAWRGCRSGRASAAVASARRPGPIRGPAESTSGRSRPGRAGHGTRGGSGSPGRACTPRPRRSPASARWRASGRASPGRPQAPRREGSSGVAGCRWSERGRSSPTSVAHARPPNQAGRITAARAARPASPPSAAAGSRPPCPPSPSTPRGGSAPAGSAGGRGRPRRARAGRRGSN